jgi:hypothetical protein
VVVLVRALEGPRSSLDKGGQVIDVGAAVEAARRIVDIKSKPQRNMTKFERL